MGDAKNRGRIKETILVTGGAGFIGSHFVEEVCNDYNVIVIDKLTYAGNEKHLENVRDKIEFVKADIADPRVVMPILAKVDYVVNFAAESHVDNSYDSPIEFFKTNVICLQGLLECARNYRNGLKKFVHISTDEVYGDRKGREPAHEHSMLEPNNPYAASKAAGDMLCKAYLKSFGIPIIIVRSSNNFGARQYPEKLISRSVYLLKNNQPVKLHGTGEYKRDWLHVKDNCSAIRTIMEKGEVGEIYNVCARNIYLNIEIVRHILKVMGMGEEYISFVPNRISQDNEYHIVGEKIKELGWKPNCTKETFHDYLTEAIKTYLD